GFLIWELNLSVAWRRLTFTFQASGKRCQIVPNMGKDRDGICKTWGQYHFETFDGIYYYFPGKCSYIFAKDCGHLEPQYTVWVHNNPDCQESGYSCHRSVSLFFSSQEEIIISGREVRKRGIRLLLPQTIGYVFIERLADYILVKTTFGFSLAWDGISGLYIKLTGEHKGKPCGLCGNYNGDQSDDLVKQNHEYTEDIAVFANSWTVRTPDDNACVATGSDFPSPCLTKEAAFEDIFFKCQILLQFPFLSCHENIDPYSYIASCINDLCKSDSEDSYCRAVTEYARACSHAGYPVRDWRDDFPACTEKCDDSFVHRDCISCCPPTCTFEKECLGSNLHCLDGCYCPDGLIMDNGTCVSLENCPCSYHGSSYAVGSRIEQECSECVCVGGVWNCTEQECPVECSVVGDSHFTTFDGRHYTFVGVCQYILVKGTGDDKFTVTLQKAPCGQNLDLACLQSVTLVLGDDMNKQVTLSRGGDVFTGPNHGIKLNGEVEIRNLSSLFILLKTRFGLKILFAKDGQRLYIQVNSVWKRRTLGLCGTFNGNLRDDFLSPAGMIEGTPQLHANAWKVSSACFAPVNVPVVDPCNINQQNIGYAAQCDILNRELFAPCHDFISPGLYYHLCRFDACKCGSGCLCNALAHYAYICGKHGIVIDFRSHMSSCAVICQRGMLYHRCSSFCQHSCTSLSTGRTCDDECAEGCNCPEGKYFEESINFCVPVFGCRCHHRGSVYQPGELIPTPSGLCQCSNGTVECAEPSPTSVVHTCPEGKSFFDCKFPVPGLPAAGVNCETTCANLAMNLTCAPSPPCSSGCICPPGMAEHRGKCYVPDSCPCTWKDWEYLSGEVIATPCYTCICRRGIFNCTYHPCPAVCTVYGDRHYSSFDGLEFDYISDCQVFLLKKQSLVLENKPTYQLWKAGYYAVVHFPEEDITILWDKKTTVHIKVGPHWKGRLAGLCGNFDKYTSNDMTTSNNLEVRSAQVFGESWTIGQCENPNETVKPCEVHQNKFPYAKKECSILYSDVFAPCRNVIDVTPFVKNCHTDTCNCNLGGDCECLCTSIAAYAYKCCQQGVSVHWRSPTLCALDCEYLNQGLGEGPYILANYGHSDTVLGVDVISRKILPLPRSHTPDSAFFYFMITPGLFKEKDSSLTLVSLESAERPNYFLHVHGDESITLEQWEANATFQQTATFFHHQGLWIPGSSAFELHSKKGFFITFIDSSVKVSKYDNSEEFKQSSSFSIEEIQAAIPYRRMCEWRYEPCATPCVRTCSDPEALFCKFLPPVEGCLPYCPKNMILDEVTLKCVYPGDCKCLLFFLIIFTLKSIAKGATVPDFAETSKLTPRSSASSFSLPATSSLPTSPEYIEPVDRCNLYICINMGWKLYNMSKNCYEDVKIPDCGFQGMPVQVNIDDCCPEWECPCQCSMLPELSIITFAGDIMALYNLASYILVKLPGEIIVAHIEKCPVHQVTGNSRKIMPGGLCMKKLNITTRIHKVLVSRLARKVEVDSALQSLPFSKHGLWIRDTGAMYVIGTPSGLSIKWAHVTGLLDIQYGLQFNVSTKTEGLCGFCNDSPKDDLKMPNRTTIASVEEMEAFIQTWEMEKSYDVVPGRHGANCTEGDCAPCVELLNKRIFTPCHAKVSPQDFCEKMWLNSTYFWNYECDTVSAYVALCHKHNICIQWRTPDYCSLTCPEGKEYQPCVQPCVAQTCLNRWYYETVPCSYLREDCVCKMGTVLHRTHSDHCIPEGKCACTDHEGQPHFAGEVWNGACTGCCMNKCLENGSIIHIEPECSEEPHPACEREGEVIVRIIEKTSCCLKTVCNCNMTLCESVPPTCKKSEKLVSGYNPLSCCPQYRCECDPLTCLSALQPECRDDQFIVEVKQEDPCCFPSFGDRLHRSHPAMAWRERFSLWILNSTRYCCPKYSCGMLNMKLVKEEISGQCCPAWHCECSCGNLIIPTCKVGEVQKIDHNFQSACGCIQYSCEKDNVCLFQEVTVLNPRQSLIQYLDGELCQTIHCLEEKDYKTGYRALDFTVENCSKQCEAYQVYSPPSSHDICCGSCKNVSCGFYTGNGTKAVYEAGSTWISNCTKYECAKTAVGAVLLSSEVICPSFNETECIKVCKKEEKICKKVTVRTTIRKQDCISQINVASCDGKCPSATIYNINIDSHLRFCKCCRENGVRNFTVPLFCLGNGTEVMFSIQEPTDCFCQWN
uniref:Otogelin like n=1 Tax=Ornithorhynchus anatinus TaxID=9258 RepID=F7G035_ORNAN